jgi:cellulose synthase/poly-beta-1,6-N-acetylglucosamine synthase-like glycosyltransferase
MAVFSYALLSVAALAVLQGCFALWNGLRFRRYVASELDRPGSGFAPRAAVFLPCKGEDPQLEKTLIALTLQRYPVYEVICAVESTEDPAWACIERLATRTSGTRVQYVVAPHAEGCSQKIANLLAAIATAEDAVEVFAFLDSDAVPHENWLAALVSPLSDETVGASTGYRWYVPSGGVASILRCVWNASTLTFLGNHGRNFCWGGSTAIRRATFERLEVAGRWRRVLSDDYEMTRSVRANGLRIQFVPQCVIPSEDDVSWAGLWQFARRQMIITRVCSPKVWGAGAAMGLVFNTAFWGLLITGLVVPAPLGALSRAMLGVIYGLSMANAAARQLAVARIFPERRFRRGAALADVLGAPLVGLFNLALIAASVWGRRFRWRGIRYHMQANDRVTVLERFGPR